MPHWDRTCDRTEEWSFLDFYKETLKKPDPNWHFDHNELHAVAVIYYKLLRGAGCDMKQELPTTMFDVVLHTAFGFADDALIKRIFYALDKITSTVSLQKFIGAFSLFLRGTLEEQLRFCFQVYDILEKGDIRRDQMLFLTRHFVYKKQDEDVEEAVKDFVDLVIKKLDVDRDGIISFEDYRQSVLRDPMWLECFGQCLPDRNHVIAVLTTFTDKTKL